MTKVTITCIAHHLHPNDTERLQSVRLARPARMPFRRSFVSSRWKILSSSIITTYFRNHAPAVFPIQLLNASASESLSYVLKTMVCNVDKYCTAPLDFTCISKIGSFGPSRSTKKYLIPSFKAFLVKLGKSMLP